MDDVTDESPDYLLTPEHLASSFPTTSGRSVSADGNLEPHNESIFEMGPEGSLLADAPEMVSSSLGTVSPGRNSAMGGSSDVVDEPSDVVDEPNGVCSEQPDSIEDTQPCAEYIPVLHGCRRVDVYTRLNKISEGTYGEVYRAQEKATGEIVALKHIKYHAKMWDEGFPLTSLREVSILLELNHPNIVNVREVVVGANPNHVYMVMEYSEHELKCLLERDRPSFSLSERKRLLYQLLSAVDYLHSHWVLHRDLKTSNLLYSNTGTLKICDFGMARKFGDPIQPYTHNVVTLWYRAPELILGQREYTTAVDMWSVGCIMAELLLRRPLFNGKSEMDALDKIFKFCGTPNTEDWPELMELPSLAKSGLEFKKHSPTWRSVFPVPKSHLTDPAALSDAGLHLLQSLLALNPAKRISAAEALAHPFFSEKPLPQREHLMPTAPDSHTKSAQERHGTRHNTASDDEQRNLFYDVESRYTFGRRVDPNRYLIELESTTQRKLAQVATHQP